MTKVQVFINCFLSIVLLISSQGIASIWYSFDLNGLEFILNGITYVLLTYIMLKLLINKKMDRKLSSFYIPKFKLKIGWILIAFLLPLGVLLSLYVMLPGKFYFNNHSFASNLSILSAAIFSTGLSAGIVEEMVFRGVIMRSIEETSGIKWGIFLPSFAFGCLHLLNGQLTLGSSLLLIFGGTIVGIMFSLLTYKNQSVWASVIVHVVWNILVIGEIINFGIETDAHAIAGYLFTEKICF